MTDDLQLLAAADPAPPSRWPDRPLDAAAERHLHSLLDGSHHPWVTRRTVLATAAAGIAATLVVVATNGTVTPAPTATPVAVQPVAAPAPLEFHPGSVAPSLAEVAAAAARRAAGSPPSAVRGSHVRTWYLGFAAEGEGFPAVVLPEEQLSLPTVDGGSTVIRVPADPTRPTDVRLDADRPAPDDAEVTNVPPEQVVSDVVGLTPPPVDPAAVPVHLAAAAFRPESRGVLDLLDGLEAVLRTWTPGPAERAAIAAWLAQLPDLVPQGTVTDRLGRSGVAYAVDVVGEGPGAADTRRTLVLDPATGAVLSIELSFLEDTGEYAVDPYAVISYEAYGVR